MAQALIRPFINKRADFILTIETKGIPIALMSARALNLPLVVARRENRINEGPLVTINYLSGSGKSMQTMSLPRRAAAAGQRAIIIDDFMKAGGSDVYKRQLEDGAVLVMIQNIIDYAALHTGNSDILKSGIQPFFDLMRQYIYPCAAVLFHTEPAPFKLSLIHI